jgi:hypothetical protein
MPGMPIHSNALIVTEDLRNKVVAWATEIASYAAQLSSTPLKFSSDIPVTVCSSLRPAAATPSTVWQRARWYGDIHIA